MVSNINLNPYNTGNVLYLHQKWTKVLKPKAEVGRGKLDPSFKAPLVSKFDTEKDITGVSI